MSNSYFVYIEEFRLGPFSTYQDAADAVKTFSKDRDTAFAIYQTTRVTFVSRKNGINEGFEHVPETHRQFLPARTYIKDQMPDSLIEAMKKVKP